MDDGYASNPPVRLQRWKTFWPMVFPANTRAYALRADMFFGPGQLQALFAALDAPDGEDLNEI